MVINCVAYGCGNVHRTKGNLTFHMFPFKRPEILKLWIKAVRRENWQPTKASRLCSAHFLPTDFFTFPYTKRILLNADAVPSIFNFPQEQKNKGQKRLAPLSDNELEEEGQKPPVKKEKTTGEAETENNEEEPAKNQDEPQPDVIIVQEELNNSKEDTSHIEGELNLLAKIVHTDNDIAEQIEENTNLDNLPSTSTADASTSTSDLPTNKKFVDVAVLTTENYDAINQLRRKVKGLQQIVRRKDLKITCLEDVIKEICETGYTYQ